MLNIYITLSMFKVLHVALLCYYPYNTPVRLVSITIPVLQCVVVVLIESNLPTAIW